MGPRTAIQCVGFDIGKAADHPALVELTGERKSDDKTVTNCCQLPLDVDYSDLVDVVGPFVRNADLIMVDGGGVGRAIFDYVRKRFPQAWAVITTGASGAAGGQKARTDPEKRLVYVPKQRMVEGLVKDVEKGMLRFAKVGHVPLLGEQLQNFQGRPSDKSGTMLYEAAPGYHDDLVMALALARLGLTDPDDWQ